MIASHRAAASNATRRRVRRNARGAPRGRGALRPLRSARAPSPCAARWLASWYAWTPQDASAAATSAPRASSLSPPASQCSATSRAGAPRRARDEATRRWRSRRLGQGTSAYTASLTSAWRNAAGPGLRLGYEPECRCLFEVGGSAELLDHVELEALPDDRRRLEGRAGAVSELPHAKEHGVAHGVRYRNLHRPVRSSNPSSPQLQHPSGAQCRNQLFDEERNTLRAVVEHRRERRCHRRRRVGALRARRCRPPTSGSTSTSASRPRAAEDDDGACGSGGPSTTSSRRKAAITMTGDRLEVDCETRQQLDGRAVDPLEVVEEDRSVGRRPRAPKNHADSASTSAVGDGANGCDGVLGHDQRQVRRQRPGSGERVGMSRT